MIVLEYDCPSPIAPSTVVDGELHQCTVDDVKALVDFFDMFHIAVGICFAIRLRLVP